MEFKPVKQFYYRINGEKENELFKKFNTSQENILRNNNKLPLYKGEWVKISINDYILHIVKPMQNLDTIAKLYNVNTQQLIDWNNLACVKLFIGQQIKIYNKKD